MRYCCLSRNMIIFEANTGVSSAYQRRIHKVLIGDANLDLIRKTRRITSTKRLTHCPPPHPPSPLSFVGGYTSHDRQLEGTTQRHVERILSLQLVTETREGEVKKDRGGEGLKNTPDPSFTSASANLLQAMRSVVEMHQS